MFTSGAAETAADRGAGDGCATVGAAERRLRGSFRGSFLAIGIAHGKSIGGALNGDVER